MFLRKLTIPVLSQMHSHVHPGHPSVPSQPLKDNTSNQSKLEQDPHHCQLLPSWPGISPCSSAVFSEAGTSFYDMTCMTLPFILESKPSFSKGHYG